MDHVSSKHKAHTTSTVNELHLHLTVPSPQIFTYRTSDPPSTLHNSSEESVTPKRITKPINNPPNLVPNLPSDPDSDPDSSDSSLSVFSDSSGDKYYKQRQLMKNNKNKCRSKKRFDHINKCAKLTAKLFTYAYKSKVVKFKLDEDPL